MAQTLEELFKSKQLASQDGKTAAVAYDAWQAAKSRKCKLLLLRPME